MSFERMLGDANVQTAARCVSMEVGGTMQHIEKLAIVKAQTTMHRRDSHGFSGMHGQWAVLW